MTYHYSFKDALQRAERINWRVEDLINDDKTLDFSMPFMPEGLARTADLTFLSASEKRTLNQIRGHAYLAIFGLVEEFILPFVMEHARPIITGEEYRARAFLEFAAEEAKHIHLFRRFREAFTAGFGVTCDVIGPSADITSHVLSRPKLSVALLILHIEWMTQRHYQESVQDDAGLDPQFRNLLLHHWMEEHQHAQLDTLMVHAIAADMSEADIAAGIEGYLALGNFLDAGLKHQVLFDMVALERASGHRFSNDESEAFTVAQHQANRWTYIGSGMSHPRFLATVGELSPTMRETIAATAPTFS
ncbi:MAG TPA: hypothetical protein VGG92_21955 [Caulobacteraceae bacterium]|jgi:hypothetical protein